MFIVDGVTPVTFTWNIEAGATVQPEDYFDLYIQDPSGDVTYQEGVNGAGWTTSYTPNDANTPGSIVGDILLNEAGLWNIVLCTGSSTNFDILHSQLVMVVTQDTSSTKSISLE